MSIGFAYVWFYKGNVFALTRRCFPPQSLAVLCVCEQPAHVPRQEIEKIGCRCRWWVCSKSVPFWNATIVCLCHNSIDHVIYICFVHAVKTVENDEYSLDGENQSHSDSGFLFWWTPGFSFFLIRSINLQAFFQVSRFWTLISRLLVFWGWEVCIFFPLNVGFCELACQMHQNQHWEGRSTTFCWNMGTARGVPT